MSPAWTWALGGVVTGAAQLCSLVGFSNRLQFATALAPARLLIVGGYLTIAALHHCLLEGVAGWTVAIGVGMPLALKVVRWK